MSFALASHITLSSVESQYSINNDAPVVLALQGPKSYCNLKDVQSSQLKEVLSKVGIAYEKYNGNTFFNVRHAFTSVEATESKSKKSGGAETDTDPTTELVIFLRLSKQPFLSKQMANLR